MTCSEWGYPYPTDDRGTLRRSSLQGPEYMRLMRRRVMRAGVTVLDQSPALGLLVDDDGTVGGAHGVHRQGRHRGLGGTGRRGGAGDRRLRLPVRRAGVQSRTPATAT